MAVRVNYDQRQRTRKPVRTCWLPSTSDAQSPQVKVRWLVRRQNKCSRAMDSAPAVTWTAVETCMRSTTS